MFEQSLLEISAATKRRKRWTALVSYSLEATAVLVLLSFPLVHTDALPLDDSPKIFPPVYHVPDNVQVVSTSRPQTASRTQQTAAINVLIPPTRISPIVDMRPDPAPPAGPAEVCPGCIPIPGGTGDNRHNPVLESMFAGPAVQPVRHGVAPVPRSSILQQGLLIRQVRPVYPQIAIHARVQGPVVLHAVIGRDGSIQQLQVMNGHPMLTRAALEAVQQWRYRPYVLNGEPVEVETQITVNFTLNGN